jgi:hypothetical protein
LRCKRRLTGWQLGELFTRFIDQRIRKRQLRRPEVPHVWRWIPLPILARLMGRCLVLKAFKPLVVALPAESVELKRAA